MTTNQDILTHKAAFLLSLESRCWGLKGGTPQHEKISAAIKEQFDRWDIPAKGKVIQKMSDLKAQYPGFDWERNWTQIPGA